jgi:hypothetical protein
MQDGKALRLFLQEEGGEMYALYLHIPALIKYLHS